ncbi:peptidoglycan editing factor PgeF [Cytophaga aurantiaca]|uniref:peptidoglycan editing factor PgeF n=1 Tax=Cytophaga aurantiaca TaxID=29530 RepID=UPI00035D3FD1|nr:peptidoglycan editing factor PgeF [Cytophaga aurantiaca]
MKPALFNNQKHWQFDSFNKITSVRHLVTGSNLHIQRGDIEGLNYGLNVPDQTSVVHNNRLELLNHLDIVDGFVTFPIQTHSCTVEIVTEENKKATFQDVDALITNTPNILIGVLSADCVPVLLADPVTKVVACIHAGWRGTTAEIVKHTISKMQLEFGCISSNIIAGIGPSISAANYEVGEDVAIHFRSVSKEKLPNGKSCIDLWIENKMQLLEMGLKEENISISKLCTYSDPTAFYSARRDGITTGRIASVIALVA